MRHIVIGTAGHIDHGKTSLIKALTEQDTDRLKEEKKRGISINLGFAYLDLPCGKRAGIIDVPGHEKFIKNMLAGISSIDLVLMVIAADEGVMPQTREHLQILKLLDIKKGIVVLTKTDLVQKEWINIVKDEIKKEIQESFLQESKIYEVSCVTKKGIEELIKALDDISEELEEENIKEDFRMSVDRVFTVSGFGTVVTGTVLNGMVNQGETIEIYPSKINCKVRGIQVHEQKVNFAKIGQRTALNLSNVKVKEIKRGDVISSINAMESSIIIDCRLHYLKENNKPLKNRQRVRLHHGTSEILCRVVILDKEDIRPGESVYVQLKLESPIACKSEDRFIIRNYSPMYTIGGGIIIDPVSKKAKRFDKDYINELKIKENRNVEEILENVIKKFTEQVPDKNLIQKHLDIDDEVLKKEINKLKDKGKIIEICIDNNIRYIHNIYWKEKAKGLIEIYNEAGFSPPKYEEILEKENNKKIFNIIYYSLIKNKDIIIISEDIVLSCSNYYKAKRIIIDTINKNGNITLAEFRDILNTSRKYALAIIEHFDSIKLTKRIGDKRILYSVDLKETFV